MWGLLEAPDSWPLAFEPRLHPAAHSQAAQSHAPLEGLMPTGALRERAGNTCSQSPPRLSQSCSPAGPLGAEWLWRLDSARPPLRQACSLQTNSFVSGGGSSHNPVTEPWGQAEAGQARVSSPEGLIRRLSQHTQAAGAQECEAWGTGPCAPSPFPRPVQPSRAGDTGAQWARAQNRLPTEAGRQGRVGSLRPQGKLSGLPHLPECLLSPPSSRLGVKRPGPL